MNQLSSRLDHLMGAVVVYEDAAVAKPARSARSAGQERCLGERLRLHSGWCERARLNHPCERRLSGRGIDQVVRDATVRPAPAALRGPARGHSAAPALKAVKDLPGRERAGDLDGANDVSGAAEANVAR